MGLQGESFGTIGSRFLFVNLRGVLAQTSNDYWTTKIRTSV